MIKSMWVIKMELHCENDMCIYEKEGKCILDFIELDASGSCRECIQLNLEKTMLEKMKEEKRKELDY